MRALIFDTETTGLINNGVIKIDKQPYVIEYSAFLVDLASGKVEQEWDELIKPPEDVTEEITKINGITNTMLIGKPPFIALAPMIQKSIETMPAVIAHNASFDKEMLDIEFSRFNEKIVWPRVICSIESTVHLKGYRLNLTDLHTFLFGAPFTGAHRARTDVEALTRCCVELFKRGEL